MERYRETKKNKKKTPSKLSPGGNVSLQIAKKDCECKKNPKVLKDTVSDLSNNRVNVSHRREEGRVLNKLDQGS